MDEKNVWKSLIIIVNTTQQHTHKIINNNKIYMKLQFITNIVSDRAKMCDFLFG